MSTPAAPRGTQQWLEQNGNAKLPGETDAQHYERMRRRQAAEIDACSPLIRDPRTGATAMIMPGLPEEHRPSGRRGRI
jgi:hypothetical protein